MKYLLMITSLVFTTVLIYYCVLTVFGLYHRSNPKKSSVLQDYPSVDILIPAHNEGKVIKKTLEAMVRLEYPGEKKIYLLNDHSQDETEEIADAFSKKFKNLPSAG